VGPAEAVLLEDAVGVADEVAIGEEEQLDEVVGRVIGRKCPGVLSAAEAGELQSHIDRTLAEFARTARRAEAAAERTFLAKAEAKYERGFAGCDGFPPIQARKALEQARGTPAR